MAGISTATALAIYFLKAAVPTEEEIAAAKTVNDALAAKEPTKVVFRNGAIPLNGRPEDAKYVAGNVPAGYEAFKRVSDEGEISDAPEAPQAVDAHSAGGSTQQPAGAGVSSLASEVGNANGAKGWGT